MQILIVSSYSRPTGDLTLRILRFLPGIMEVVMLCNTMLIVSSSCTHRLHMHLEFIVRPTHRPFLKICSNFRCSLYNCPGWFSIQWQWNSSAYLRNINIPLSFQLDMMS